jgi:hypothetical protein
MRKQDSVAVVPRGCRHGSAASRFRNSCISWFFFPVLAAVADWPMFAREKISKNLVPKPRIPARFSARFAICHIEDWTGDVLREARLVGQMRRERVGVSGGTRQPNLSGGLID